MKSYICDICKTPLGDPFKLSMKEFQVGYTYDKRFGGLPENIKIRKKIHICSFCFQEFVRTCNEKKAVDESE